MTPLRAALLGGLVALCASAPAWGPPTLRGLPWFRTERVEVAGARLLAPHEVLAAGGIGVGGSVWDDPAPWEARLRAHPVVAEAEVTRRLPGTLHVRIVEKRPAALAETAGALAPVTAAGEVLPVDPARVAVDVPLLRARATAGRDRRVREGDARAALAQAGRLAELDPALAALVSEVRPERGGGVRLTLGRPQAEVVLPPDAPAGRLRLLRAALADVRRRQEAGAGPARLDLRFDDQVVVRISHAIPSANP